MKQIFVEFVRNAIDDTLTQQVKSYLLEEEEKEEEVIERFARMLNNEIYKIANGEWLYETVNKHEVIYSLMYGETYIRGKAIEDQIITIKSEELEWSENKKQFIYVWGWPGPDFNLYTLENYGKAWAFSKEELVEFWDKRKAG